MTTFTAYSKTTTCPYCGVGCGVDVNLLKTTKPVTQQNSVDRFELTQSTSVKAVELNGCKTHPANQGRLCVKGTHLLETVIPDGRLTEPTINGKESSWDEATTLVAEKMQETIEKHGPDAVAFYVSGQLLTEDYYVANKLMKGFVGSGNIDTNSRLCMSSAVTAYKRAFGEDAVPCNYQDLEETDLLVLIGSNAAWTHPVLYQRVEKAKTRNPNLKVVLVDPRKTASASLSDLHLQIRPSTDTTLFNGLLNYIAGKTTSFDGHFSSDSTPLNQTFIDRHTDGFADAINMVCKYSLQYVSEHCDVDIDSLETFYKLFCNSEKAISFYSMGVNQSVSGVDNANAIINCHLATGKVGKPGCGPFSITGQPNAMGGREVGGLANMLAAHMDIENPIHHDLVSRFWETDTLTRAQGLKAVDMFDAINEGKIKFIWVMATNPVVSMPNRNKIEAALRQCETVVVSDCVSKNDTLDFAHIALPATGWSEKDGTVTNSERCISRQRALFPPLGNARHDWQIMCDVANKMGFEHAFSYDSPAQIFSEHCALTAFENGATHPSARGLNLEGLASLSEKEYEALQPIQWPVTAEAPEGTARLFTDNKFFTSNQRAKFIPIVVKQAEQLTSASYPYILNTGRSRDQWHTMTRTGNAARLHEHSARCELLVSNKDAMKLSLEDGCLVKLHASVNNDSAAPVILPIRVSRTQRVGEIFAPIHWSKTWSSNVNLTSLFTDARDALSGQPELKHAAVSMEKQVTTMQAKLYSKVELPKILLDQVCEYWTKAKLEHGFLYDMAMLGDAIGSAEAWYQLLSSQLAHGNEFTRLVTPFEINAVKTVDEGLSLAMFIHSFGGNKAEALNEEAAWVNSLLALEKLEASDLSALLSKTLNDEFKEGKLICSCHQVREKTIVSAIQDGADSVVKLGQVLKCGTNCGSCKSELGSLVEQHSLAEPKQLAHEDSNLTIPIMQLEALK